VDNSFERGNELSGSIKCCDSTECLHNLWPLEWHSNPQSSFVILERVASLRSNKSDYWVFVNGQRQKKKALNSKFSYTTSKILRFLCYIS
jgi:hypothetical protein